MQLPEEDLSSLAALFREKARSTAQQGTKDRSRLAADLAFVGLFPESGETTEKALEQEAARVKPTYTYTRPEWEWDNKEDTMVRVGEEPHTSRLGTGRSALRDRVERLADEARTEQPWVVRIPGETRGPDLLKLTDIGMAVKKFGLPSSVWMSLQDGGRRGDGQLTETMMKNMKDTVVPVITGGDGSMTETTVGGDGSMTETAITGSQSSVKEMNDDDDDDDQDTGGFCQQVTSFPSAPNGAPGSSVVPVTGNENVGKELEGSSSQVKQDGGQVAKELMANDQVFSFPQAKQEPDQVTGNREPSRQDVGRVNRFPFPQAKQELDPVTKDQQPGNGSHVPVTAPESPCTRLPGPMDHPPAPPQEVPTEAVSTNPPSENGHGQIEAGQIPSDSTRLHQAATDPASDSSTQWQAGTTTQARGGDGLSSSRGQELADWERQFIPYDPDLLMQEGDSLEIRRLFDKRRDQVQLLSRFRTPGSTPSVLCRAEICELEEQIRSARAEAAAS